MKQFYMSPLVTIMQLTQTDVVTASTEDPIGGVIEGEIKDVIWG